MDADARFSTRRCARCRACSSWARASTPCRWSRWPTGSAGASRWPITGPAYLARGDLARGGKDAAGHARRSRASHAARAIRRGGRDEPSPGIRSRVPASAGEVASCPTSGCSARRRGATGCSRISAPTASRCAPACTRPPGCRSAPTRRSPSRSRSSPKSTRRSPAAWMPWRRAADMSAATAARASASASTRPRASSCECMPRWPAVRVPLADAVGGVLRETIVAERDQPPFDRVTMDGIAIAGDAMLAGRRRFAVAGTQGAGAAALRLGGDGRVRRGHDRQRAAGRGRHHHSGGAHHARGRPRVTRRARLRRAAPGSSSTGAAPIIARGEALLGPGTTIGPAEDGDPHHRRPRRRRHHPLAAHRRRLHRRRARGRRPAHRRLPDPLLQRPGHRRGPAAARISARHAGDAARRPGGAAPGDRPAARELGPADPLRRRVHGAVRPRAEDAGRPRRAGRVSQGHATAGHADVVRAGRRGKVVFALPGNPVSSLVCLVRYVVPGLEAAMGASPRPVARVRLGATWSSSPTSLIFCR